MSIQIKLTTQLPDPMSPDLFLPGYTSNQVWHVRVMREGKELKELHMIFEDPEQAGAYANYLDANIERLKQ